MNTSLTKLIPISKANHVLVWELILIINEYKNMSTNYLKIVYIKINQLIHLNVQKSLGMIHQ